MADIETPEPMNDPMVIAAIDRSDESGALLNEGMAWLQTPALRCDRLGSILNAGQGVEPVHPRADI